MDGAPSKFPDWAYLPELILHWISEKVKSILDYVRSRMVCSPWQSTINPKPDHLPPRLPWVMIPCKPNKDKEDDRIRLFYDLWNGKMHKLHLQNIIGKSCCASHHGWLLFIDTEGTDVFLLNPLTRARIDLPPLTTPVRYLGEDRDAPRHDTPWQLRPDEFWRSKVICSSDLNDRDCLITLFLYRTVIFCCRVRDPCWTMINNPLEYDPDDVMYYNGRFYLLYDEADVGAMVIIDPDKPNERIVYNFKLELQAVTMQLLEGMSGVYLVGMKYFHDEEAEEEYELYQFQEQPLKLVHITDTSNTTIFNTDKFPFLAVCSNDWESLGGGSMYKVLCKNEGEDKDRFRYCIASDKLEDGEKEQVWDIDEAPLFLVGPNEPDLWFQPSFV